MNIIWDTRVLIKAAILAATGLFVLLLSMVETFQFGGWKWVVLVLSSLIVFGAGWRFHRDAYQSAKTLSANMNTLISIGTTSAWVWSVVAIFRDTNLYFETAAIVVLLVLLGRFLEQRSLANTRSTIAKMGEMMPKKVLLENGEEINIRDLKEGMNFKTREGEFIAADGTVVAGEAALDTSMLTGEPLHQQASIGSSVIGSTIVAKGTLTIEATHTGNATFHSYILRLVEEAEGSALPVQKLVDKVSKFFTYAVLGIAAATIGIWLGTGSIVIEGLEAGISVLIIACPCALGLATPIAITTATGRGAQQGILLKNTNVLEAVKNIDIAAFDKTGTLTEGKIQIEKILLDPDLNSNGSSITERELMNTALALESQSIHPIAIAITSAQKMQADISNGSNGILPDIQNFQNHPGLGVTADLGINGSLKIAQNTKAAIGRPELFEAIPEKLLEAELTARKDGNIAVYCGASSKAWGLIVLSDVLRDEAAPVIEEFKKQEIKTVMITGDSKPAAELIAARLGIDEVHAEVLPDQKAALIRSLQNSAFIAGGKKYEGDAQSKEGAGDEGNKESKGKPQEKKSRVLMVGDGTNDAAALTTADLAVAIGSGTEAAIESADIALTGKDLRGVLTALGLAKKTRRIIVSNIFWAFFYNASAIPLAAVGLLNPIIAAGAMSFSSLFVVLNSARLRGYKSVKI